MDSKLRDMAESVGLFDLEPSDLRALAWLIADDCAALCLTKGGTMSMFVNKSEAQAHNNAIKGCVLAIKARYQLPTVES